MSHEIVYSLSVHFAVSTRSPLTGVEKSKAVVAPSANQPPKVKPSTAAGLAGWVAVEPLANVWAAGASPFSFTKVTVAFVVTTESIVVDVASLVYTVPFPSTWARVMSFQSLPVMSTAAEPVPVIFAKSGSSRPVVALRKTLFSIVTVLPAARVPSAARIARPPPETLPAFHSVTVLPVTETVFTGVASRWVLLSRRMPLWEALATVLPVIVTLPLLRMRMAGVPAAVPLNVQLRIVTWSAG